MWVHNQGAWCEDLFGVFQAVQDKLTGLWQSYDWLLQHPPPGFVQDQGQRWALRLFNEVRRRHFLGQAAAAEAKWLNTAGQDLNLVHDSEVLGKNLKICLGFEGPEGFAGHHIVGNARTGVRNIDVLASQCNSYLKQVGVDINEASNGMWLPQPDVTEFEGVYGPQHSHIHTAKYYEALLSRMQTAKTPDHFRNVLPECADLIVQGKFPYK